ncbi:C-type LECtin [Caenorhabditis elegans]|uniref:C-type LECtin n=1 Tax=Caenorhabditis elegans TaxID=6239 RepID=Q22955_CAEEL|nr:C-type LECtin [Caenorhabditis elegans]CCD62811.1 C-type LECtin [Caenorhabditis elegans]|eukprot:NP_504865.1 C-type LECtin [Caenorhabditis elegans]
MHLLIFVLFYFFNSYSVTSSKVPVCTNEFTLINNKCLKLFTTPANHSAAEKTCRKYGATLVTVKNENDNHAISTFAGTSASLLWIGLYCFGNDPSKCLWDDSTGSADVYDNFASGFPLVDIGKCVYYSVQGALTGKWLTENCDLSSKAFMCELPTTFSDSCIYNYNGYCYDYYAEASFVVAQNTCEQFCGDLATIHTANENRYILTVAQHYPSSTIVRIGATWPASNVYQWVDGLPWEYKNIDLTGPRGGDCMVMSTRPPSPVAAGYWFGASCTDERNFICKRPAGLQCVGTPPSVTISPIQDNPSFCNSTNLLAPGVVTSPNFPRNYNNNAFCTYQLSTLGSYNILLRFAPFSLGTSDYVIVYDGESASSPVIGNYSGTLVPFSLISSSNNLLVVFNGNTGGQGFSARYTSYAPLI